tara:strand:+ start:243 stop:923 length:681 start_codon:yes stop_codon:yes gene_type:complete
MSGEKEIDNDEGDFEDENDDTNNDSDNDDNDDNDDDDDIEEEDVEDVEDVDTPEYNDGVDDEDLEEDHVKNLLSKEDIKTQFNNGSSFIYDDDLEINDSTDFLQKFDDESKKDYIISNHQECLNKNYEEIKILSNSIRNKDNIIIDELHRTLSILTKYEKTKILGIRTKQLNNNCKPYINISEKIIDNFVIACMELDQKKLPFIIERPLPNNTFEYWKLSDLEILQ